MNGAQDFGASLRQFSATVAARSNAIFLGTVAAAHESITVGSSLTGALGQPVDTGFLRNSWHVEFEDAHTANVITSADYAKSIEDGISSHGTPIQFKSAVGGAHSVSQTITNFDRIVASENAKADGGAE